MLLSYNCQVQKEDSRLDFTAKSRSNGAEREVAYLRDQIEPQLLSRKNVMIATHGNSLRSIIMYLDKLTSQKVISLELSTGILILYIFKEGRFIRRGMLSIGATAEAKCDKKTNEVEPRRRKRRILEQQQGLY
ncbi:hypothetical protein HN51_044137 [Arachis hypogaea]